MNKSIFQIGLPAVFAGFFLLSCNVNDSSTNTTTALEAKSWKLTGGIEVLNSNKVNFDIYDSIARFDPCFKHEIWTFGSNNIFLMSVDSSACGDTDSIEWSTNASSLKIIHPNNHLLGGGVPFGGQSLKNMDTLTYVIESVSKTTLRLTNIFRDSFPPDTGSLYLTFTAQ